MNHTDSLNAYCERHGYKVLEPYTTMGGESHSNARAKVLTPDNEVHYLYFDPTCKRKPLERLRREHLATEEGYPPPSTHMPKPRGWRNVTLDNRRRAERERQHHQRLAEPGCNGLCNPNHSLYEGTCPIHGVAVILEGLSNG